MFADRSRLIRLLLIAATVCAAAAWPTRHHGSAYAQGDDDDDGASSGGDDDGGSASGDDDSGGDDDDGSGSASAGDDDGGGGGGDDDANKDQPPVTAGGLYTKRTFPISAIERPLTLINGMTEVKVALQADLSDKTAFNYFGMGVSAHIGLKDYSELQFEYNQHLNGWGRLSGPLVLPDEPSTADMLLSFGYEGALSYDLVDFRAAFLVPVVHTSSGPGTDASNDIKPGIAIGFPIKYRVKPQIAIIALRSLMTINFTEKPDLTPQLGVIAQPVPQFAVLVQTGITIARFDTTNAFSIPASLAVQFTPSNAVDLGLQFSFTNLKPQGDAKFYDARAFALYAAFRL